MTKKDIIETTKASYRVACRDFERYSEGGKYVPGHGEMALRGILATLESENMRMMTIRMFGHCEALNDLLEDMGIYSGMRDEQ